MAHGSAPASSLKLVISSRTWWQGGHAGCEFVLGTYGKGRGVRFNSAQGRGWGRMVHGGVQPPKQACHQQGTGGSVGK